MECTVTTKSAEEEIDPALILPNPAQPRRDFPEDELYQLADSIRRYGILQPLTVRRRYGDSGVLYELIAGERRLRAAVIAGLGRVPCRVLHISAEQSAELAIIENIQRRDLTPFEEATAISLLLQQYGVTQEELGERLSVSQSYIANKLRLLRLSEDEQQDLLAAGLTERHARALLRLSDPKRRRAALNHVIAKNFNVAQTEHYVEELLAREAGTKRKSVKGSIADLRLFYNSLNRALHIMRGAGMQTGCEKKETEDGVEITIFIRKKQPHA